VHGQLGRIGVVVGVYRLDVRLQGEGGQLVDGLIERLAGHFDMQGQLLIDRLPPGSHRLQ
jgi:hypothetical protein